MSSVARTPVVVAGSAPCRDGVSPQQGHRSSPSASTRASRPYRTRRFRSYAERQLADRCSIAPGPHRSSLLPSYDRHGSSNNILQLLFWKHSLAYPQLLDAIASFGLNGSPPVTPPRHHHFAALPSQTPFTGFLRQGAAIASSTDLLLISAGNPARDPLANAQAKAQYAHRPRSMRLPSYSTQGSCSPRDTRGKRRR